MTINFTKMQGLGNDFVVIDTLSQSFTPDRSTVQQMADRKYGIGCDQLLLLEPCDDHRADFFYRIFNADGHEVENCGNGARCIGLYIQHQQLLDKKVIVLRTLARDLQIQYRDSDQIVVDMGVPSFQLKTENGAVDQSLSDYLLDYQGQRIRYHLVDLGNPHAIIFEETDQDLPIDALGCWMNAHKDFPDGINVSVVNIVDENKINLRVYERGAGVTMACGSAACAAVAVGIARQLLSSSVDVCQLGGVLNIEWHQEEGSIMMMGGANFVFQGVWGRHEDECH